MSPDSDVYSRKIIMFFISQVSGLVKNFNVGIYSDTIYVINVKLCMVVLLRALPAQNTFSDLGHISKSQ